MDWSTCSDIESRPDVLSGAAVVVGTRVTPGAVLDHVEEGYTPEQIAAEIFPSVPLSRIRRLLAFARRHEPHPA